MSDAEAAARDLVELEQRSDTSLVESLEEILGEWSEASESPAGSHHASSSDGGAGDVAASVGGFRGLLNKLKSLFG